MNKFNLYKTFFISFLVNISQLLPLGILILFLNNVKLNENIYILLCILSIILILIILSSEYDKLYKLTYENSSKWRMQIGQKLKDLPLSYFSKHNLSDLAQTIMSDCAKMEHATSHALSQTIGFIAYFILVNIIAINYNYILGITLCLPFILNVILLIASKKMQISKHTKYYHILRENAEAFQETIELQQEIQSLGIEKVIKNKLYKKMDDTEVVHYDVESSIIALLTLTNLLLYLEIGILILVGTRLYINNQISLVALICSMIVCLKINEGAFPITLNLTEFFYIDARIKRLNEIKNAKTQKGKDIELKTFDIELKNVSFKYENEKYNTIKNVSFKALQNEVTAIVGKSGCGKSTLLKLITRLFDYDEGNIKIDNYDIKDISTNSLFKNISIVFQDVILFNTSIKENIRIGNLNASDEEVMNAYNLANCNDMNIDDIIGENGINLSGVQRQRISIARAFLKNAPILILDEISASLDVENETKIQQSLQKLIRNKTVIVVSHRIKSIENVDKIVVLDKGTVVGVGTHKALLNNCEVYKELVNKVKLTEEFNYMN